MARTIDVLPSAGRGGESLSYTVFEEQDQTNDRTIEWLGNKLEQIRCVDISFFSANLVQTREAYMHKRPGGNKSPLWMISFDGLKGNHIAVCENQKVARNMAYAALLQWGRVPLRWEMLDGTNLGNSFEKLNELVSGRN